MAQIMHSPLRVNNPTCADVVYVPVLFSNKRVDYYRALMDNPRDYLPFLGTKPHFMVLGQPRDVHVLKQDPLVCVCVCDKARTPPLVFASQVTHPNSKHFYYLTTVVPDIYNVLNVVRCCAGPFEYLDSITPHSCTSPTTSRCPTYTSSTGHPTPPGSSAPKTRSSLPSTTWLLLHSKSAQCVGFYTRVRGCLTPTQVQGHFNITPEVQWSRVHLYEQCMAVNSSMCTFQYAEQGNWGTLQRCATFPCFSAEQTPTPGPCRLHGLRASLGVIGTHGAPCRTQ